MIAERQLQHVLEKVGQHDVAALVRQPVGEPGDQGAGDDDEQAEGDPGADQRQERERGRAEVGREPARQGIDDVAEQDRLDELRDGQRDIGERQYPGEPQGRREQVEHANIHAKEGHTQTVARHAAA